MVAAQAGAAERKERLVEEWSRLSTCTRARHEREVCFVERVIEAVRRYAGHSVRAGLVSSAAAEARLDEIMDRPHRADVGP